MISISNVKNTMFAMISNSNFEKHNVFNGFKLRVVEPSSRIGCYA
jgi:hypothetical protein